MTREMSPALFIDDAAAPDRELALRAARSRAHSLGLALRVVLVPAGGSDERQAGRAEARELVASGAFSHVLLPRLDAMSRDAGSIALVLDEALRARSTVIVLSGAAPLVLVPGRAPAILGALAMVERNRRSATATRSHETTSARGGRPGHEWTPAAIATLHAEIRAGRSIRDIARDRVLAVRCGDAIVNPSRSAIQRALDAHPVPATDPATSA